MTFERGTLSLQDLCEGKPIKCKQKSFIPTLEFIADAVNILWYYDWCEEMPDMPHLELKVSYIDEKKAEIQLLFK